MDVFVVFFLASLETFRLLGGIFHTGHMESDYLLVRTPYFGGALGILKKGIDP
jgi:hypothetical protein